MSERRLLARKEVLNRLGGISNSTLNRMILRGAFPQGLQISQRRVGWPSHVVDEHIEGLAQAQAPIGEK
ncbi:MAG: AlpA family phage regulatory protein [Cystobacterineae bacterium]|nr:AlpA family phage regulatory protein [Cystobacterineae bacterium]